MKMAGHSLKHSDSTCRKKPAKLITWEGGADSILNMLAGALSSSPTLTRLQMQGWMKRSGSI